MKTYDEELRERIAKAKAKADLTAAEMLYEAWAVIAAAGEGDWENESLDWQRAAKLWRSKYADAVSRAMRAVIADTGGEGE